MKIHIDTEDALVSSIGGQFRAPLIFKEDVIIDINVQRQEKEHWCWAALAASLAEYYGTSHWSQQQIAQQVAEQDAQQPPLRNTVTYENTNVSTTLDKALRVCACMSHWSPGKPSFARIQYEVNLGRPLCMRIQWHAGDAHYAMLHGYSAATQQLLIKDTLHGPARIAYADFPRAYRECGGVWTETYWTDKFPEEQPGYE